MTRDASAKFSRRAVARRAFTLVEMIVVVTIIALLATLVVPRVFTHIGTARERVARSKANAIASAVKLYAIDTGISRITDDFDLEVLRLAPEEGGGTQGPYLDSAEDLLDPWNRPFVIMVPGEKHYDFDIISLGEDGQLGTKDDIVH